MELAIVLLFLVLFAGPTAWVLVLLTRQRLRKLETRIDELTAAVRDLGRREAGQVPTTPAPPVPSSPPHQAAPAPVSPATAAPLATSAPAVSHAAPGLTPEPAPPTAAPPAPVQPVPAVRPEPAQPEPPLRPAPSPAAQPPAVRPATTLATPSAGPPPVPPAPTLPAEPRPAPSAPPPRPPVPQPVAPRAGIDWESLVGVKLFSALAGIALLVAAVFFLRYSIERGWLQPAVRVAIGTLVGVGLLVLCEMKAARKYPVTANALDASALAVLFSTFYAAHALWSLIPLGVAFVLLALVAAVAVLLSIRRASLFIAVLGLLGGFSAPALLSTGENRPVPLFLYLLLLNAGLAWVALKQSWPALSALTLVFTTMYQWGWAASFLTAEQLPLAVAIFLTFPAVPVAAALARRRSGSDSTGQALGHVATLGALVPLLFALHVATVTEYGRHFWLLFGMLLAVDVGLFAVAWGLGRWVLHAAGALGTVLAFGLWMGGAYSHAAWPAILPIHVVFALFYLLAAPVAGSRGARVAAEGESAAAAGPLLITVGAALAALEPLAAPPWPLFGATLLLLAAHAATAVTLRVGWLYYAAAFSTLLVEATWSSLHLDESRLGAALAVYGAFGLVYVGTPVVARRWARPLGPPIWPGLVLLGGVLLLLFTAASSSGPTSLWGLAVLLGILNAGLFAESVAGRVPTLSMAGGLLSWWVLSVWWEASAGSVPLLASLSVVLALGLLMFGGHAWASARPEIVRARAESTGVRPAPNAWPGAALGFVAHVFLAVVAADPTRAVPPWPIFAVLTVLTLAVGALALFHGRGEWQTGGLVAAATVLGVWAQTASGAPWPGVAVAAGLALAAFAMAWPGLSRSPSRRDWSTSAIVGLAAAPLVLALAALHPSSPGIAVLVPAHALLAAALLWTGARSGRHDAAIIAVCTTAVAVLGWMAARDVSASWGQALLFASALYAVIVAYPLVLGPRAGAAIEPYLGPVLASAWFFFAARHAMMAGGWGSVIGLLPLAQAAAMAIVLRRLLGLDQRATPRVALVAAAALALVTLAVPLQFEHQWITIAWALEGAALAWLHRRVRHRGLLWTALGLLATVFVRLALNPEVLAYEPRGTLRVLNWYLYTYGTCAAAFVLAALWLRGTTGDRSPARHAPAALFTGAGILLFLLLNIEIADYFATGPAIVFRFGVSLAQDFTYTLGWLIFGLGLLTIGIAARSHAARIAALALITVTVVKGFLYDLSSLGGLYRVGSFAGLAISLALVSIALQKFVLARAGERP